MSWMSKVLLATGAARLIVGIQARAAVMLNELLPGLMARMTAPVNRLRQQDEQTFDSRWIGVVKNIEDDSDEEDRNSCNEAGRHCEAQPASGHIRDHLCVSRLCA